MKTLAILALMIAAPFLLGSLYGIVPVWAWSVLLLLTYGGVLVGSLYVLTRAR